MKRTVSILCIVSGLFLLGCESKPGQAPVAETPEAGPHPTLQWILACRSGMEGFGWFPGDSAFTGTTGMALEALADLGALESFPGKDELVRWLKARQQADGGFIEKVDYYGKGINLPWGTQSALEPTFWAVRALNLLGARPDRPEAAAAFIAKRQTDNGAFEAFEYARDAVKVATYSTFWAVAALKELGLPVPDSAKVVEWVRDQQNTIDRRGGFALSPDGFFFSSTQATYYAVATLALLGAAPERPVEVKRFLLSTHGQEANGGFELGHGDNWNNHDHFSRMKDTYCGVSTLGLLGMPLSDSDTSRAARPAGDCAAWIGSVQNPDGGFSRFGATTQTPLLTPSEMMATCQAVRTLTLLGRPVPRPAEPQPPAEKMDISPMQHRHPGIDFDDPVEVWAFRRIAAPIYDKYLRETGSQIAAIGMLSRWVREATGPENQAADRHIEGRKALMHGWGQCGTMSWLLQTLSASVDHPARGAYVFGDANCEVLVREKEWDKPHWICYIPFTNEYVDPEMPAPDGTRNGWSALDLVIDHDLRVRDYIYESKTILGDHRYWRVWIEAINDTSGAWGEDSKIDTTMNYTSPAALALYPGGSW